MPKVTQAVRGPAGTQALKPEVSLHPISEGASWGVLWLLAMGHFISSEVFLGSPACTV